MPKKFRKFFKTVGVILLAVSLELGGWPFPFYSPVPEVHAFATIDSTVSTTASRHNGSSPTVIFTDDQTGYVFYTDSDGRCKFSKTTNGGSSWGVGVTVDNQTDCEAVAVWYDQWTPGDTTGNIIHVVTMDPSDDDLWYTTVDTGNSDAVSTSVNATSGQAATLDDGINIPSITKATNGTVYIGAVDSSDSYVFRCSSSCTSAVNWSEAGTSPFTNGDDWLILMPLADGDVLAIWWDVSASDILTREFEDGAGTWQGSWTTVNANAEGNTTYDGVFAATLDKSTNDIYLVYADDANTLGGANDDLKTVIYDGSTWTATGDVITNDPNRGITGVSISFDMNTSDVYVAYTVQETVNYSLSANAYFKVSRDDMATWSSEYGPMNAASDDIYGLRSNLMNTERLFATWYRATPDDLFGEDLANLVTSGERLYVGMQDTQAVSFSLGSTNNYVGAVFTLERSANSADVTSIKITEAGTINANTGLTNLDLYYETASDCSYDGNETLFGTAASFNGSDEATVTGTISVGTSQICVYPVFDVESGVYGTVEFKIENPATDITVASTNIYHSVEVKLDDVSNVQQSGFGSSTNVDSTASTVYNEHGGPSPTVVFTDVDTGYAFYIDSDGRAKFAKSTDGGANFAAPVQVDPQTDAMGVAVWYDQWTPGDTTGQLIHVLTWDGADTFYTTVDTGNSDAVSTTLGTSGANQGGGFAAGQNWGSITKATTGELFMGIIDNSDSFVLRCSSSCTASINNWTEASTSGIANSANDGIILMPLSVGDLLAIWWDSSADDILSREFEDGAGAWQGAGWTTIDNAADENSGYDTAYAATLDKDTGTIYLAYVEDESFLSDANGDIETWSYDGTSWTKKTEILTNDSRGITQLTASYDGLNDTVYVIYSVITDPQNFRAASVYFQSSTDGMTTWNGELGSLNNNPNREITGLRSNLYNTSRIYATWYGAVADDIFGQTVADLTATTTFTLSYYRWYQDSDSENVTDPWGNPDLGENTNISPLPVTNDAPGVTDELRLRVALTVGDANLSSSSQQFKLQFKQGTDASCTAGSWSDVGASGGGEVWTYATSSVTDGVSLSETKLTVSDVVQVYTKSNPTATNPNSVTVGQDMEYDFHIRHNGASNATRYSFRVVESDGTALTAYSNCPTLTTEPDEDILMRHGNFFSDGVEQGFFW